MVIVTSRELGVLKSWGLSSVIYKMPELDKFLARQLFCSHAFKQPSPLDEFEDLVKNFLDACNGLPLSLKVIGAHLYGSRSKVHWKSELDKIKKIVPSDIQSRLRLSYDALDEQEKEMFLDVACFLIGETEITAIAVWDGMDFNALAGLQTLVDKSLVELVQQKGWDSPFYEEDIRMYDQKIRMHDHLRDMGREIASRQSSYRLWWPGQIDKMKKHFKKEIPIRGILPAATFEAFKKYNPHLLGISNGLQILHVEGSEFTEEFASLSEDLVWLEWKRFGLTKFPSWLIVRHLRVLELSGTNRLQELWEDNVDPPLQLRKLIIIHILGLERLPTSIGRLQYLEMISIRFQGSSLPEEFCCLRSLEYLRLHCKRLCSLPAGFGNLRKLKHINLMVCNELRTLPDSFKNLIHLEHLKLTGCIKLKLKLDAFENIRKLKSLKLEKYRELEDLPNSKQLIHLEDLDISSWLFSTLPDEFGNLTSLRRLNLHYSSNLCRLPDSFSQLIRLKTLDLTYCKSLFSLPAGFGNLTSLRHLKLNFNLRLSRLPDSFVQLIRLENLDLMGCKSLSSLPDGFGNLTNLKHINLEGCYKLRTLPDSFKHLIHLEHLVLSYCAKLKLKLDVFETIRKLNILRLEGCRELEDLPSGIVNQTSLTELGLEGCIKLRDSPTNIGQLVNLQRLKIEGHILGSLQTSVGSFSRLKHICIFSAVREIEVDAEEEVSRVSISNDCFPNLQEFVVFNSRHLKEIERLPVCLKRLEINRCEVLKKMRCLTGLASLEKLVIEDCPLLEEMSSFSDLVSLKFFKMKSCQVLKKMSCLTGLASLEELVIFDCPLLEEMSSFSDLVSLKSFEMEDCPKVEKIDGLQHSKSLKVLCLTNKGWKVIGISGAGMRDDISCEGLYSIYQGMSRAYKVTRKG